MAFEIPTVNPSFVRSAEETPAATEVDTQETDTTASENVDTGKAEGDTSAGDTANDDGDLKVGDNLADGRSAYIKRAEYDKLNKELAELRSGKTAEPVQPALSTNGTTPGGWDRVAQFYASKGFSDPAAVIAAIEQQERDQADAEAQDRAAEMFDPATEPVLFQKQVELERKQQALDRRFEDIDARETRDVVSRIKNDPTLKHADLETVQFLSERFKMPVQVLEAIGKHTNTRTETIVAELEKKHATELEAARKQARLDLLKEQKNQPSPGAEGAGGGASTSLTAKNEPRKPGSGFSFPLRKPGFG